MLLRIMVLKKKFKNSKFLYFKSWKVSHINIFEETEIEYVMINQCLNKRT